MCLWWQEELHVLLLPPDRMEERLIRTAVAEGMDTEKDFHRFGHHFGGGSGPVVSRTDRREPTQNNRMARFHHMDPNLAHGYVVNCVLHALN